MAGGVQEIYGCRHLGGQTPVVDFQIAGPFFACAHIERQ